MTKMSISEKKALFKAMITDCREQSYMRSEYITGLRYVPPKTGIETTSCLTIHSQKQYVTITDSTDIADAVDLINFGRVESMYFKIMIKYDGKESILANRVLDFKNPVFN